MAFNIEGLCSELVNPSGPLQLNELPAVEDRLIVLPMHTGVLPAAVTVAQISSIFAYTGSLFMSIISPKLFPE